MPPMRTGSSTAGVAATGTTLRKLAQSNAPGKSTRELADRTMLDLMSDKPLLWKDVSKDEDLEGDIIVVHRLMW